jgi:hypothetical protein
MPRASNSFNQLSTLWIFLHIIPGHIVYGFGVSGCDTISIILPASVLKYDDVTNEVDHIL